MFNKSDHGGSYSWSMFIIENDLENNYFDRYDISQFNYYRKIIYFIGIGTSRENIINSSSSLSSTVDHVNSDY